jgi:hypothetical protein
MKGKRYTHDPIETTDTSCHHHTIMEEYRPRRLALVSSNIMGDGAVMMVPENLLAFVDEVKMTGQLETKREGLLNIAASFLSVMKSRFNRPVGERQTTEGDAH